MAPRLSEKSRLSVRGIQKTFGGTRALEDVSFEVEPGSVHAVLGENGAGKSTLMKILAGSEQPDRGTLLLDGAPYAPDNPRAARQAGIAIVYQELSVCPHLTVAENIALGVEPRRFGFVSSRAERARAHRALEPLGADRLELDRPVSALSAAERQLVEIARALAADDVRVLILDEPTSSLAQDDVERLFRALGRLRERGLSILYISHFLEEVRRIADTFTVIRDGRSVVSGRVAESTNDALVAAMAGQDVALRAKRTHTPGEPLLTLREVAGVRLPVRAELVLRRGEVLGIAGLVGSGRSELLRAIFGLEPVVRGEVRVLASRAGSFSRAGGPGSPALRLREGIGLLSEDRKEEGLLLERSIAENLTLSRLAPLTRLGFIDPRAEARVTSDWIARLGIRARGPEQRVSELSGGNQQKLALARLLYHDVDVLLLDEPTRGIDVRSRAEIHAAIDALVEGGKSVLVVSSQLSELLQICDRVAVMHRGLLGPARPVSEVSESSLLLEATGA